MNNLLRSVNVVYDANDVTRISHFQPTSKAVVLLKSMLGYEKDRAFFIAAPYGSGKSLTATYLVQLIENNPKFKSELSDISSRVSDISSRFGQDLVGRVKSKRKGLSVAIQGACSNFPKQFRDSLVESSRRANIDISSIIEDLNFRSFDDVAKCISRLSQKQKSLKIDKLAIVWDEFGRHIESLISEGKTEELNLIQSLAEVVNRISKIEVTLSLFLHQGLLKYAGKASDEVQREWKKIEGRFVTIQYVDTSKEIYLLIASVIKQLNQEKFTVPTKSALKTSKLKLSEFKIFEDFSASEKSELLALDSLIHTVALNVLPKIAAKVAQHERTLFTFLNSHDWSQQVTVASLFDYFSDSMASDTSFGGSYHQWLEGQSALSKVDDELESSLIKTACLLGIGLKGERKKVSKAFLEYSLTSSNYVEAKVKKAVQSLIVSKLLLHRKNSNTVSLWHGTDIDVSAKLEEEKQRLQLDFDALTYLKGFIEPPVWKPVEHNSKNRIQRYYAGIYMGFDEALDKLNSNSCDELLSYDDDGVLVYLLPKSIEERKTLVSALNKYYRKDLGSNVERIVWVLPNNPIDYTTLCLDVFAYQNLIENPSLIDSDPLILTELQQHLDDSYEHLQKLVDRAVSPNQSGLKMWNTFYKDDKIKVSRDFRLKLSSIADKVFSFTPQFNNEMLNRKNVRSTLINSRKKLILAILDQAGEERLGFDHFNAEASMFSSLLQRSGLYGKLDRRGEADIAYGFAKVSQLSEPAIKKVWREFEIFLTRPKKPTSFQEFFEKLQAPPFGLRKGLIPVLLASAFRAFPAVIVITDEDGEYLDDIMASHIESICSKSDVFKIEVLELSENRKNFLDGIYSLFNPESNISIREKDLIRRAYDAIEKWKSLLPESALTSRRVSEKAKRFQQYLTRTQNPSVLFFEKLPTLANVSDGDIKKILKFVASMKTEIEEVVNEYYSIASKSLFSALHSNENNLNKVLSEARSWISFFPKGAVDELKDGMSRGFVTRMSMPYNDPESLLDSISSLLIGKGVTRWDDSSISAFEREILDMVHRIEESLLKENFENSTEVKSGLTRLAKTRMMGMYQKLVELAGEEEALAFVEELSNEKVY